MSPEGIEQLLTDVQSGRMTVARAIQRLRSLPFENLGFASLDHHRSLRQGFPEVLLCEGKTAKQSVAIARALIKKGGPFLATRAEPAVAKAIMKLDRRARYHADARIVSIDGKPARRAGHILILTAGTADVPVAEEAKGERLLIGVCEDKNYRTIAAAAMANDHRVSSKTPMDVNLAKQLVILIHDMGVPLERIVMDPTTGALAYGIEYGYSVMERLRLAALQGDSMTQQPMIVTPGEETWKAKESKVGEGVPESWGDWKRRAINWETLTASSLVHAGADVVVLRHPESLARVKKMVKELMIASRAE